MLSVDAGLYAVLDYRIHHGRLPLGPVALVLQPSWAPAIVLMGLAVWLFPNGRLPARLRWVFRGVLAVGGLWWAGAIAIAVDAVLTNTVRVESTGDLHQLSSLTGSVSWWGVTQIVFFALLGLSWLVWLPSQVGRYRRATGVRRQQLKWLISGASATIIGLPITISFSSTSTTLGRIVEGIGSAPRVRDRYRAKLDNAPWDEAERARVIDEALVAFECNVAVFDELALRLDEFRVA